MPDSLLVRPASPEDFSEWLELWKGYNAFYGRSGATALSEDVTRMTWIRFFDAYEPVHALVAERAGKLLGMAHYLFHRSTIMLGPTCYMQDLFTTPDARGQGVGRALIEAVYDKARGSGASRVYWHTQETNATAMRLYDGVASRSGFVVYAQRL